MDQAYWQSAIAARPAAAYKGYIIGGLLWVCAVAPSFQPQSQCRVHRICLWLEARADLAAAHNTRLAWSLMVLLCQEMAAVCWASCWPPAYKGCFHTSWDLSSQHLQAIYATPGS